MLDIDGTLGDKLRQPEKTIKYPLASITIKRISYRQKGKVMNISMNNIESLSKHLDGLPPELLEEVIDFIDFLKMKKVESGNDAPGSLLLQQDSLDKIWHDESEDLYAL